MKAAARLLFGVLLGIVLIGSLWFSGLVEPPEPLARRVAVWAAVYPGPVGEAEVEPIPCPPLARVRIYVVCTGGCEDVWRVILVKGLQPSLLYNFGRIPPEDEGTTRRRINAAVGRERLRLDTEGARALVGCYLRFDGLVPGLVLPAGGDEAVEAARAEGEAAMLAYADDLADDAGVERIPIEPTADGFESVMLYWATFLDGDPVLRLRVRLAPDGQVREMRAEPLVP